MRPHLDKIAHLAIFPDVVYGHGNADTDKDYRSSPTLFNVLVFLSRCGDVDPDPDTEKWNSGLMRKMNTAFS